jgi:hypothetical protein
MVGKLIRLKWFDKDNPRPTEGEWNEAWVVVEDNTMTIATDPKNPYPAGEILVLDDGKLTRLLIADVEVISV